ncbi:MAG: hypothetical protein IPL19_30435 [Sandaracinaceae bacterium]|nr:hypothetical protein [Sandaracinaceae bacterium]
MTTAPHTLTSALAPDLAKVRAFILDEVASGKSEWMADCVVSLLERMREVNHELLRRDIAWRRAKPPSETMRRMAQEQLFPAAPDVANDNEANISAAVSEPVGETSSAPSAEDATSTTPAGDLSPEQQAAELLTRKKRGPKKPHKHGRGALPAHLERVPDDHRVPKAQRTCPSCHVEVEWTGESGQCLA